GGSDEVAVFVTRHRNAATVEQQLGAFVDPLLDQALHTLAGSRRDQRTEISFAIRSDIDFELLRALDEVRDPVATFTLEHGHGSRNAALPGRAESGAHQLVEGHFTISIRQDVAMILGAHHGLTALAVLRGATIDF